MRRLTFVIVTTFLFAWSMPAQTVDEIVAKSIVAHGGMARLKSIKSLRLTGDVGAGDIQAGFIQVYKRPMKMRLDVSVQGLTLTQAYDGQSGWQIVPFTGKKEAEPMAGDDLKNAQETADFEGPLTDYKLKGNTVELIGKEKIEGTDAYHLKVTLKNGNIRNLYLNAVTFLAFKTVDKSTMRGKEVEIETKLSDYKEVEGLMFPYSMEQHPVGDQGPDQKITLKKIELNIPLEDSIFKMPAALPPPTPAKSGSSPASK